LPDGLSDQTVEALPRHTCYSDARHLRLLRVSLSHFISRWLIPRRLISSIELVFRYGADIGIDVGPTLNLRRDIVHSIKRHVRRTIVLSHEQAKSQTLLNAVDPMNYHNRYREMFLTWLEIAVGVQVPHFVNAGGHFADAISILRGYKDVTVLPDPKHCLSGYYDVVKEEKSDDDLLDGEH
jgi:hypothetical protein